MLRSSAVGSGVKVSGAGGTVATVPTAWAGSTVVTVDKHPGRGGQE